MNFLFTFLDLFFKVVTTDIISFPSLAAAQEFAARKVKFDPSVSAVQIESVKVLDRDFWITIETANDGDFHYVHTASDGVNSVYFHSQEYIEFCCRDAEIFGHREYRIYRFRKHIPTVIFKLAKELENDFWQEDFDDLIKLLDGKDSSLYDEFEFSLYDEPVEDEEDCEEVDEIRPLQFFIDDEGNEVIFPL